MAGVGVRVARSGLGDGMANSVVGVGETGVIVGVGCGRRCGLGQMTSTVPQTILTVTNKLSTQNRVSLLRPFCERVTTYLPVAYFPSQAFNPCKAGWAYGSNSSAFSNQNLAFSQSLM